ncbi:YeeE/YedE family protein [Oxalobacter sp. OttesenSCG-928-P03]|nr:YeeE/YedE family protein [Oxalobacter sp. OttesenSCG-928-P03]
MNVFVALVSGLLFGAGIMVSGMGNPEKVLAFLDLAGNWDPSLALVMAAAIPVSGLAFRVVDKRKTTLAGRAVQLPDTKRLDWRLVMGSALFGIGWGLAGICPGPAIALPGYGSAKGLVFALSMFLGMGLFTLMERRGILDYLNAVMTFRFWKKEKHPLS